jgi:hypothetical protein
VAEPNTRTFGPHSEPGSKLASADGNVQIRTSPRPRYSRHLCPVQCTYWMALRFRKARSLPPSYRDQLSNPGHQGSKLTRRGRSHTLSIISKSFSVRANESRSSGGSPALPGNEASGDGNAYAGKGFGNAVSRASMPLAATPVPVAARVSPSAVHSVDRLLAILPECIMTFGETGNEPTSRTALLDDCTVWSIPATWFLPEFLGLPGPRLALDVVHVRPFTRQAWQGW